MTQVKSFTFNLKNRSSVVHHKVGKFPFIMNLAMISSTLVLLACCCWRRVRLAKSSTSLFNLNSYFYFYLNQHLIYSLMILSNKIRISKYCYTYIKHFFWLMYMSFVRAFVIHFILFLTVNKWKRCMCLDFSLTYV